MKVHVVIPTVSWSPLLARCIDALIASGHPAHDTIVVFDGAGQALPEHDDVRPSLRTVTLATNRGFAAACNAGFAAAPGAGKGHVVVFLNDDAVVPVAWRAELALLDDTRVGALGFQVTGPRGPRPTWPGTSLASGARQLHGPTLAGSCFAIRHETYERFGGMDESFVMYGEETDLFHRLQRAGLALVESPLEVWHHGEGTMSQHALRSAWHSMRNPIRCSLLNDSPSGVARKALGVLVHVALPRSIDLGPGTYLRRRRTHVWPIRVGVGLAATFATAMEAPALLWRRRRHAGTIRPGHLARR